MLLCSFGIVHDDQLARFVGRWAMLVLPHHLQREMMTRTTMTLATMTLATMTLMTMTLTRMTTMTLTRMTEIMKKSKKMMDTVPMMTNFLAELSQLLDELSQLQDMRVLLLV